MMLILWFLSAILSGVVDCRSGFDLVTLFRQQLLPAWFDTSPDRLQSVVPFELKTIADGVGPVFGTKGDTCEAQFAFTGQEHGSEKLEGLTFVIRGPKSVLVNVAKELMGLSTLVASDDEFEEMVRGETLRLSKREPEDPRKAGVLTFVNMTLEVRSDWELEFEFVRRRDPQQ